MKPFGALLSYEEAQKIAETTIKPLTRMEIINLEDAPGRVIADDITATLDTPPFNRGAMDGYAVKSEDTFNSGQFNPKILDLVGEMHAGDSAKKEVGTGQCIQIATGAMMPEGADAVVMVEDTETENGHIKIFKGVVPQANVSKKGEDIKQGTLVLKEGAVLDAGKIGVLASQGLTQVKVYEKPMIAVLPTGEEVGEIGKKLEAGQVYDINTHTISAVVQANGGIPIKDNIVGDTPEALKSAITTALKNDLVVLSGGSSVGERDLLVGVLEGWGQILFHGIQIKPGKPTLFSLVEDKPLFGMPGYPTSCLINTYLFLLPAIRKMAHLPPRAGQSIEAKLSRRIPGSVGRKQFLTVRLENGEAVPAFKESGAITSVAEADGYIEITANVDLLEKGTPVVVTLF